MQPDFTYNNAWVQAGGPNGVHTISRPVIIMRPAELEDVALWDRLAHTKFKDVSEENFETLKEELGCLEDECLRVDEEVGSGETYCHDVFCFCDAGPMIWYLNILLNDSQASNKDRFLAYKTIKDVYQNPVIFPACSLLTYEGKPSLSGYKTFDIRSFFVPERLELLRLIHKVASATEITATNYVVRSNLFCFRERVEEYLKTRS